MAIVYVGLVYKIRYYNNDWH